MTWKHGESAYMRHLCTDGPGGKPCDICREANTVRQRREKSLREARRTRLAANPTLAPHGTVTTYQLWGCRCVECRVAMSRKNARRDRSPYRTITRWKDALL